MLTSVLGSRQRVFFLSGSNGPGLWVPGLWPVAYQTLSGKADGLTCPVIRIEFPDFRLFGRTILVVNIKADFFWPIHCGSEIMRIFV